jgi:hypothetical protein
MNSNTIQYLGKKYSIIKNGFITINDIDYCVVKNSKDFENSCQQEKECFIDCEINYFGEKTQISGHIFNKSVSLNNCIISNTIFSDTVELSNVTFKTTNLTGVNTIEFYKDVIFRDDILIDTASSELSIGSKTIQGARNYNLFSFHEKAEFNNVYFTSDNKDEMFLDLENCKNAQITFTNCKFKEKFKIRSPEYDIQFNQEKSKNYKAQQKNKAQVKSLIFIDCEIEDDTYLRVGFIAADFFTIKNLRNPQNAELNIGDCHFKNFKLTNFRNIGKFKLFKINILDKEKNTSKKICKINSFRSAPLYILEKFKRQSPLYELNSNKCEVEKNQNNNFQIDNTSIGDTDFQSVNLSSFEKITMFDNIFDNVKYTNINWGEFGSKKDIAIGGCENHQNQQVCKLEKQQDTYRTLKNVASNNNDQPQAIKFYAKEMENAYQLEQWSNFSNKFTLWFNKWTNSFGLNWIKSTLILLFVIAPFFYFLLLLSLDCYCQDKNIFAKFFEFLNPTHKIGFVAENGWGVATYFIDIFFRIIEGLMIYQIIQAFRKYTRKL